MYNLGYYIAKNFVFYTGYVIIVTIVASTRPRWSWHVVGWEK